MSDDLERFLMSQPATPDRPLQGKTVLVVEDSRYASEAIRLLCLRSGARIRRADSLASAHRHLRVYRPSIVIVDMGLPDGSGADLIRELAQEPCRVPVLIAISGDDATHSDAIKAGADRFMAKPLESLAVFQQTVLELLPKGEGPTGLREVSGELVHPDEMALQDDLSHMAEIMGEDPDNADVGYIAQFLGGVARSAHDTKLEHAADDLARAGRGEGGWRKQYDLVAGLVQERLAARQAL
ncbi:KDP operon transcriptional regulatory protein KdpE [Aliiroseovarius sp. xm-m-379]|uniref:response regulator n=1 Tax=unclassified Aliiroseovarius TaxID=2623558 RepID=UPI00156A5A76|nr:MULTISPECIES: response regulator [unclassified Aliiroseovarius]NRP13883.1 KDP operon transcriptional regulatory protein KdpE [Aliiroseovarius sp. xm-d-517]NRP25472.1 KDP operon transcriptional regulatory protein KdpE [Aliiroseovarius sp. xm-m-379]NRP29465.1 KDP operon transcriptional regulatory protein KdpE [Aliiroseovarius sp. xm-m-314]NRP34271.1 KDP operon transcriptional regulatory protein KdpE [Aliiroseovarius sp. xm-a-104]NRP41770.1 KDP operon transcriptional regulatory protein KdpE [A